MDTRSLVLVGALGLTGLGLLMTFSELLRPPPATPTMTLAMAKQQIQPYTIVTQDMVASGDTVPASAARQRGAWALPNVVGNMTTNLIAAGDTLTTANLLPIEDQRVVSDMNLEVVSFQASVDKTVAGRIRPGSLINLYGYGRGEDNQPFTKLIQGRLWVVAVSAGGSPVGGATLVPDERTGELIGDDSTRRPGTTLTVAVPPAVSYKVIDALGAQGLGAWVTLAANTLVSLPEVATAAAATMTPATMPMPVILTATVGPTPMVETGWGWGK